MIVEACARTAPVSYTHLDVYKRQDLKDSRSIIKIPPILFIVTILILEVKMVVDNGAIQIIK